MKNINSREISYSDILAQSKVAQFTNFYYYTKRAAVQGRERLIYTLSVRRLQPHNSFYRQKEEKGKSSRILYQGLNRPIRKHQLLKPASPTPSNKELERQFHRDTERGIKVLRYCEVPQEGGTKVYPCANRALSVTCTSTYGPGRAPLRGCTGCI